MPSQPLVTPNPKNVVTFGKARFTWMTSRLIRMEYAGDGIFEDRPTLAVMRRNMPVVDFGRKESGKGILLRSEGLTLSYKDNGKPFSKSNLSVEFKMKGQSVVWRPGLKDKGNLKGTARTLDGYDGERFAFGEAPKLALSEGLVSRSGWALVDDSTNVVLAPNGQGQEWVSCRAPGSRQDYYLLAYGHDYRQALKDFSSISGQHHLPPRFALGMWWTRYWAYLDKDFENLAKDFDRNEVPLDVMVIDMDWHKEGWTGYTWDERFFPDHAETLKWLKSRGLKISLNIHPAEGVGAHETVFDRFARRLGKSDGKTKRIEFDCTDPAYMKAYFEELHHPHEKTGVDFWWLDWQQGMKTKMEGLDPLPWLNHLHATDLEKRGKRPMVVSRYGGLGGGRYPVGFSGDALGTWDTLALETWFTACASNVLFGYWSHDIGGIFPTDRSPELFTRWIQYGAFSPVLRTHVAKSPTGERRVWEYPEPYFRAMQAAIAGRYEMVPYIYTENRKACDSGVSLCRPMYYEYPETEEAYKYRHQYQFGDQLIVAPVVKPADAHTGLTETQTWLPPGQWFDLARGEMLKGPAVVSRRYALSEIPIFARCGSVLPGQFGCRRLNDASYKNLMVTIVPGPNGAYDLYEDDGLTQEYVNGKSASIRMSHADTANGKKIRIHPARGTYKGFEKARAFEVRLPGCAPAKSVTIDGRLLKWQYRLASEGWTYDGDTATVIIRVKRIDVTRGVTLDVKWTSPAAHRTANGIKGLTTRLKMVLELWRQATDNFVLHANERLPVELAQAGNRVSRRPETFESELRRVRRDIKHLPALFDVLCEANKQEWKQEACRNALLLLKQIAD